VDSHKHDLQKIWPRSLWYAGVGVFHFDSNQPGLEDQVADNPFRKKRSPLTSPQRRTLRRSPDPLTLTLLTKASMGV
jgi:hypothetical protein